MNRTRHKAGMTVIMALCGRNIMKIIKEIIKNTEEKGNFSIEWNPQRSYYQTVEDYLEDNPDYLDFVSEEEKKKAIEENSLVFLQWYIRTPVGFNTYAASNLEALFKYMEKEIEEE